MIQEKLPTLSELIGLSEFRLSDSQRGSVIALYIHRGEEAALLAAKKFHASNYDIWKQELIRVTNEELASVGRINSYKINDAEAKKCFDGGMTPYQTFREHFDNEG